MTDKLTPEQIADFAALINAGAGRGSDYARLAAYAETTLAERDQLAGEVNRFAVRCIERLTKESLEHAERWSKLREDLEKLRTKLGGIAFAWRNRKCMGQGTSAILSVESTFGDVREAAETEALLSDLIDSLSPPTEPKPAGAMKGKPPLDVVGRIGNAPFGGVVDLREPKSAAPSTEQVLRELREATDELNPYYHTPTIVEVLALIDKALAERGAVS